MTANASAVPATSRFVRPLSSRLWQWAALALLLLEIAPIWSLDYFPSQDGPSHLHNAAVIAEYGSQPAYGDYYLLTPLTPAGNLLTQFLLAGFLKLVGFGAAEKVLLTCYFVLFFAAFRYLLLAIAPEAGDLTVLAGVLAPNRFLFMGFWNFCFSLVLLMAILGWYVHRRRREVPWTAAALCGWTLVGVLLYLTHSVALIVCIVAVGAMGLPELIDALLRHGDRSAASIRRAVVQYALPLLCLFPSLVPMLTHLPVALTQKSVPESLGGRLWTVYSLASLHTIAPADPALAKAITGCVAFALVVCLAVLVRRRQLNWPWIGLMVTAAVCAGLAVFGPDAVGSGTHIHLREAFCALLFFVLWIASVVPRWPRACVHILVGLVLLIGIRTTMVRYPVMASWNGRLSAVVRLGQKVRPGATVLPLIIGGNTVNIDPMLHSVGLLSSKGIVNLANYETAVEYFTTKFQPERSPFPRLGTILQLTSRPPVFDIAAYERNTQGHVDYLLILDATQPAAAQELRLYPEQLAAFTLVGADEAHGLRLYARR